MSPIGQQQRVFAQPTAQVRNADGSADLRLTIWYPAAADVATVSIDVGPADAPYMLLGQAAIDAPFAGDERYPVILYSHGNNGSVQTTAWFGTELARHGYVVIAPDHPGNNLEDEQTTGGALLWWLRAGDLQVALEAVANDPILGSHIDPELVGVSGFSMGGITTMMALGGVFDGKRYDDFCLANPGSRICPPAEVLPIFDAGAAHYPEDIRQELVRMVADRRIPAAKAGFVIAPAAIGFTPESMARIDVPVTLIVGSDEALAVPEVGAQLAASMIPGSTLVVVPGANHDSFINRCSEAGIAAGYLECATATEQDLTHRTAIESALAVFDPVLKPSR